MKFRGNLKVLADSGFFHVLVLFVFVQGVPLLAQFGASRFLEPESFGRIRVAESVLSSLSIIAALGMPTLAVRETAMANTDGERRALIVLLLRISLGSAVLTCGISFLALWFLFTDYPALLLGLVWLIVLANSSRCIINFYIGLQRSFQLAYPVVLVSMGAIATIVTLVAFSGEMGWVVGRFAGEAALLAVVGLIAFHAVRTWPAKEAGPETGRTIRQGTLISGNLSARTLLDNMPLLVAPLLGVSEESVGLLGLAMLFATSVALVPATIAALLLTRMSAALKTSRGHVARMCAEWTRKQGILGLSLGGGALILVWFVVPLALPAYTSMLDLMLPLSLAAGVKAVNVTLLTTLSALGEQRLQSVCNALFLVVAVATLSISLTIGGVLVGAYSVLLLEGFFAVVLWLAARRSLSKSNLP